MRTSSIILALLLTMILVVYSNCGAQKAIQQSLENAFAVQINPNAESSGDPNSITGTYYRAFYTGNGDVNYIEMTFGDGSDFEYKTVVFPGADYNAGQIDEKSGTIAEYGSQFVASYTQEHCDPVGTDTFVITFTDASDSIVVNHNGHSALYYNRVKYTLPQTLLDQIGDLSPAVCQ